MNNNPSPVKASGSLAFLKNVQGCMTLVHRLRDRQAGLPGIGVVNGPSGYGKTWGSIYAQNKTRAIRVEVGDTWTRKSLLEAVLIEAGIPKPRGTIAALAKQAIAVLGDAPDRPLFIDEADRLVDKGMIETVRELHESSQVPVLLIGEEQLPEKLTAIERVHNRVLDWYPAQPCDLEDTRKLSDIFLAGVEVDDALLDRVREQGEGRARRIVVTLAGMAEWVRNTGVRRLDLGSYKGGIFTGQPPRRRPPPRALKLAGAA